MSTQVIGFASLSFEGVDHAALYRMVQLPTSKLIAILCRCHVSISRVRFLCCVLTFLVIVLEESLLVDDSLDERLPL